MSTFTKRIDATIRDVDHMYDFGDTTWYFDQDAAWNVGNPGSVTRNIGLRFTGVNVAKGATITSAKITFTPSWSESVTGMNIKIQGIDEDNTAEFVASPEDSARTRTKTTASVTWSGTISYTDSTPYDTPDIKTIVQEIVDRGSWSSGNAMAFFLSDNGSTSGQYISMDEYGDGLGDAALLTINYDPPVATINVYDSSTITEYTNVPEPNLGTTTRTVSAKALINVTKTQTVQAKADIMGEGITPVTRTKTISAKGFIPRESYGIAVTKPTYNVLTDIDPTHFVFDTDYGTLKYHTSGTTQLTLDSSIVSARAQIAHGLGYIPFVELYTESFESSGTWYYVPFYGYGATTFWEVTYTVDPTYLTIYVSSGAFLEEVNFNVKYFIFKNELIFNQTIYVSDKTETTDVVTI